MTRLSDGPFGPGKKKLAELSDAELAAAMNTPHCLMNFLLLIILFSK